MELLGILAVMGTIGVGAANDDGVLTSIGIIAGIILWKILAG